MSDIEIRHEDNSAGGAFFIEQDGKRIGQQIYDRLGDGSINIVHTEVDERLRGQRIGRRLLDTLVAWARETKTRVAATCPYAKKEFEKDASIRDVLA